MAAFGEIRPWETETPGERLFLLSYGLVRTRLPPLADNQSYVVSAVGLSEFVRLAAAMELTHRCINAAVEALRANPHCSTETIRRDLRSSVELYAVDTVLDPLAEQSRLAALACIERKLTEGKRNQTHKQEKPYCCWCGRHTSRGKKPSEPDTATIEHLWPEYLGGTSIEENLTIACKSCNSARQHAFTWAWFAVQACNEKLDANNLLPRQVYLALGLHRLMRVASGQTRVARSPVSLKEAAKILRGAIPLVHLQPGRRYTFFEILQLAQE